MSSGEIVCLCLMDSPAITHATHPAFAIERIEFEGHEFAEFLLENRLAFFVMSDSMDDALQASAGVGILCDKVRQERRARLSTVTDTVSIGADIASGRLLPRAGHNTEVAVPLTHIFEKLGIECLLKFRE